MCQLAVGRSPCGVFKFNILAQSQLVFDASSSLMVCLVCLFIF